MRSSDWSSDVCSSDLSTWVCGYALLAGGQGNEEKVYDYINAFLDDDTAEYLVTEWGYGHANQAAMERIDQETLASMDYDNLEAFRANTLWQAPIPTALRVKMIDAFENIKGGSTPPLPAPFDMKPPPRWGGPEVC